MPKCSGCGVELQTKDPRAIGYTPDIAKELCQRCFRLTHYDDLILDVKESLLPDTVLRAVNDLPGFIVWTADVLDLCGSFKLPINLYLPDRDIVLAVTKADLMPLTLTKEKLLSFLRSQLKENNLKVKDICILGNHAKSGLNELQRIIKREAVDSTVILIGNANSGKSTLLRALTENKATVSRYPGTTLAISEYAGRGFKVYDTPGLMNTGSCLQYLKSEDLKTVIPKRLKKRKIFQIYEDQSFAVGGLVRLDCREVNQATVVFYCAETLNIHRGKASKADQLWDGAYGKLLTPVIGKLSEMKDYTFVKADDKIDICINGLGFIALSGEIKKITLRAYDKLDITLRKGMI